MQWLLAIHIIVVICWFAGLFYLPRLFVYHAMTTDNLSSERFKVMERKLFWGIMTPSAVASAFTGMWLLYGYVLPTYDNAWWLHIKLISAGFLLLYHLVCYMYLRDFAQDRNQHSHVFYRWFNEVPVLLLLIIVIMVIVKPF